MTKYEMIFEAIQQKYENGEITFEHAEKLNNIAYEKYAIESEEEDDSEELVEDLYNKVKDGEIKLSDDDKNYINGILGNTSKKDEIDKKDVKDEACKKR